MAKGKSQNYLAIDVGGSKTVVALFDDKGEVVKRSQSPTIKDAPEFIKQLIKTARQVCGRKPVRSIGLALPGSFDPETRTIIACGNLDFARVNIAAELEDALKLPVAQENDANLAGLAEANLGTGRGYRTVLYVTVSTGVGSGIIIDSKILPGLRKSEGGMMVIHSKDQAYKRLEDLVAGPDFKERFGMYGFDVIDPNIWDAFARDLGAGLFNMITMVGPDIVILGGGMSVHFPAFRKSLLKYVEQLNPGLYPTPPIKQATNVETAVLMGAYLLAKDQSTVNNKQKAASGKQKVQSNKK